MKLSEISYADAIPELNITDLSSATIAGQIDNKDVWVISDLKHYIVFFKDDLGKIMAYIAMSIDEHDGYNDLARMHNKSSVKGLITALLQFARGKGFKFCIPNTEPLTNEGFNWLTKLINGGGRGFVITDQTGQAPDLENIKKEWINSRRADQPPGPTSIFIEGRIESSIGTTLLERFPSKWLLPATRFIGNNELD